MYDYDIHFVDTITSMHGDRRDALWRWIAKQPEPVRIEAMKMMADYLRQNPAGTDRLPEYVYSALCVVLNDMHRVETKDALQRGMTVEEAQRLTDIRIERIRVSKWKRKKRDKLELIRSRYMSEIGYMREKGLSWRDISSYLRKYHHVSISHGYLQRAYTKIREEEGRNDPVETH
jgi:hypothetical protein